MVAGRSIRILFILLTLIATVSYAQNSNITYPEEFTRGTQYSSFVSKKYELPLSYDAKVTDVASHSNTLATGLANSGKLSITFPPEMKVNIAQPVNMRGEKIGDHMTVKGGKLSFQLGKYAPASFILK